MDEEFELFEEKLDILPRPLTERAREFLEAGRRQIPQVNCFDFVPSNYEHAWNVLASLPPGKLCEWGSGLGIVVGLAELLGFEACGIELDETLAESSRELLRSQGLTATIYTGSYYDIAVESDYYYVYSWPSQFNGVQARFYRDMPPTSKLLICNGQDDIRIKRSGSR